MSVPPISPPQRCNTLDARLTGGLSYATVRASLPQRIERRAHAALWLVAIALLAIGFFRLRRTSGPEPLLTQRRIGRVDFRSTPLDKALRDLGASAGVRIDIDREALASAGVNLAEPITLRLHDVELGAAFDHLAFNRGEPCAFEPRGKVLVVTAHSKVPTTVRVYDVHDLIDSWMARPVSLPVRPGYFGPPAPPASVDYAEVLMRLITDSVQPEIWADNGGTEYIGAAGKNLIITGRPEVHRGVQEVLAKLRAANAEQ